MAIFYLTQETVKKYNVGALFLQLIAARIISVDLVDKEIKWNFCKEKTTPIFPIKSYEVDERWGRIFLQDARKYALDKIEEEIKRDKIIK